MLLLSLLACDRDHPPEIRRMELSPSMIAEGEDVEVLVEVADEDGALDLVAGRVLIGGDEVARLQTYGVAGTFVAAVAWEDLLLRVPEGAGDPAVDLRVVVTDTAGERAEASRALRIDCPGESAAWCSSRCVALDFDDDHCGACGEGCVGDSFCARGECIGAPDWTRCQQVEGTRIDCDAICADKGKTCVSGCLAEDHEDLGESYLVFADDRETCDDGGVGAHFVAIESGSCGTVVDPDVDPIWARCCCQ